jgi:hypothetical protein
MNAITWKPGTDSLYDPLFDYLRELHYRDKTHHLWSNYNREHFINEAAALSIVFDSDGNPTHCASVLKRSCWPDKVYRILNRLWRVDRYDGPIKNIDSNGGLLMKSQLEWLKANTDCELAFVSRESKHFQKWLIDQCRTNYELNFEHDDYLYLTCPNPGDTSCWQRIIYQGNNSLLESWSRKVPAD